MASSTWPRIAAAAAALLAATIGPALGAPASDLKIVILRHAEKPKSGDNLSCQGQNRALQLPAVLARKFDRPTHTYVPALQLGKASKHARMFETVMPLAIKENLTLNSSFDEVDVAAAAKEVLRLDGTVLMVWNHSQIVPLVRALGVPKPPPWPDNDFDSIWVVTFTAASAVLSIDRQDLAPALECGY